MNTHPVFDSTLSVMRGQQIAEALTYRCYRDYRRWIGVEILAGIFPDAALLEQRYQNEKVNDYANEMVKKDQRDRLEGR